MTTATVAATREPRGGTEILLGFARTLRAAGVPVTAVQQDQQNTSRRSGKPMLALEPPLVSKPSAA